MVSWEFRDGLLRAGLLGEEASPQCRVSRGVFETPGERARSRDPAAVVERGLCHVRQTPAGLSPVCAAQWGQVLSTAGGLAAPPSHLCGGVIPRAHACVCAGRSLARRVPGPGLLTAQGCNVSRLLDDAGGRQRAGPDVWSGSKQKVGAQASGTLYGYAPRRLRRSGIPERSLTGTATCRVTVMLEEDDASLA